MLNQQDTYALRKGEPPRLVVFWGFFCRNVILFLDWILITAILKLIVALFSSRHPIIPTTLQLRDWLIWQQSMVGTILTGLLLLGTLLIPDRYAKLLLRVALGLLLADIVAGLSLLFMLESNHSGQFIAFEGLAALGLYQALGQEQHREG